MAKVLSEKAVYKKVASSDFSSLSVEQLESFVSILHRISPEMAKQLMNQFSDFRMSANRMTGLLRLSFLRGTKPKRKMEIRSSCESLLKELDSKLSQQRITDSDKEFIENRIIMVACLLKADTKERRAKAAKILALVSAGVLAVAGALSLLLLAIAKTDDSYRDESSDSDEKGADDYDDKEFDQLSDSLDYYEALDKIPDIELKMLDPNYDPYDDPESPFYIGPTASVIEDEDEDDFDENDESYAAQDYIDSRPWGIDNNGYWDDNCLY